MNKKLDKDILEKLYLEEKSYKEIALLTGYSENSVNGYFWKTKGKMNDSRKFRRNKIEISQIQKEILFGTLLGDGNIQKQKIHSYSGNINHSIKQLIYCKHLQNQLNNITSEVREIIFKNKKTNKEYLSCSFYFKNNYYLKEFYDMFYYKDHKKDIPLDLQLLTPRAMAYWFMDDGSANGRCSISIATCSFSLESLIRLQNYLKDKYNIEITIIKDNKIYFRAKSGKIFYNLVKEFIIPEMMYKFKFVI